MKRVSQLFTGQGQTQRESLTPEEKSYGRRLFYLFYTLNGVSIVCLMNNILVLYAIRNGMSDSMIAVMVSFVHLTMPFMLLGKPSIARFGAARTRGLAWFFRYLSASVMILAPFVAPFSSQAVVTGLILIGAFGFAMFRSIGTAPISPLWGEVAEDNRHGSFISTTQLYQHISRFVTMGAIILVFWYVEALWVYQIILAVGCLLGLYASTIFGRMPESNTPVHSARKPIWKSLYMSWKKVSYRRLMLAWCAAVASYAIVLPFMMIAVKKGYDISDFTALIFALILVLGSVTSSFIGKKISDVIGARRLLMFDIGGLMFVAIFWSLAPDRLMPIVVGSLFFLAGYFKTGLRIGVNHHFFAVISEDDRVGYSMLMRIASGVAAGLAGSVLGGGLLKLLSIAGLDHMNIYRRYFLIILGVLGIFFIIISRIKKTRERLSP